MQILWTIPKNIRTTLWHAHASFRVPGKKERISTFRAALKSLSSSSQSKLRSTVRHAYAPSSSAKSSPAVNPRNLPCPCPVLLFSSFASPPRLGSCPEHPDVPQ